jgi:hypothetical protein
MARHGRKQKAPKKQRVSKSDYFTQPGRRGVVIVLRRPIGNRATAKICGIMPTRVHAKMLINQLEKAESVVKDLFLEATDDGIEALEAVLAACCSEVMAKGPKLRLESQLTPPEPGLAIPDPLVMNERPEDLGGPGSHRDAKRSSRRN